MRISDWSSDVCSSDLCDLHALEKPSLRAPDADSHKYNRGMVAIVGGAMAGASLLAAEAAMRTGAGYVALLGGQGGGPHALVHKSFDDDALIDERIGALLIGPGLGRDDEAARRLDRALADRPGRTTDRKSTRLNSSH